jgi:hypothetical protein
VLSCTASSLAGKGVPLEFCFLFATTFFILFFINEIICSLSGWERSIRTSAGVEGVRRLAWAWFESLILSRSTLDVLRRLCHSKAGEFLYQASRSHEDRRVTNARVLGLLVPLVKYIILFPSGHNSPIHTCLRKGVIKHIESPPKSRVSDCTPTGLNDRPMGYITSEVRIGSRR